jgi:hypothetical protein
MKLPRRWTPKRPCRRPRNPEVGVGGMNRERRDASRDVEGAGAVPAVIGVDLGSGLGIPEPLVASISLV